MKASFIIPSWHYWADPLKLQPMWELYYATVLNEVHDLEVDIIDLRGVSKEYDPLSLANKIPEREVYLFWIMKSGDAVEVEALCNILKRRDNGCKIIAGGTHCDMCTERAVKYFDKVITGPGESALREAIFDKSDKRVLRGNYLIDRFDITPFPDRSLLPEKSIFNHKLFSQYGNEYATSLYMSRGCIYKCGFCVYNVPNELQVRSEKMLDKEIAELKQKYNIKAINLRDEVAIHPNLKISESCMKVIRSHNVKWRGQTTTLATRKQLEDAADSGCVELSVGVETVEDNAMKIINKSWQNKKGIKKFFADTKELGIKTKICLILGLPGESRNIVEKTLEFLEEVNPDYASVSGFCPVPGSPIANNPEKYGIEFIDNDLSKHAHLIYRYATEEEVGLPFRYKEYGPWGKTFTRNEIVENIKIVQGWLNKKSKTY